jgi:GMP synthase-like glutamine amidotransferase
MGVSKLTDIVKAVESEVLTLGQEPKVLTLGHVGMGTGTLDPFDQRYQKGRLVTPTEIAKGADIDALVIWGGEDISPSLYGELPSKYTGARTSLSRRDQVEAEACFAAMERNIPLIGVCRGAQLLCALAGGRLIQHVNSHSGTHGMKCLDEDILINTTSVHHQMMYPFDVSHVLLAQAWPKRSNTYVTEGDAEDMEMHKTDTPEPEIVWFPDIKGLAIQGHPEFVGNPEESPFVQYCLRKVDQYILNK